MGFFSGLKNAGGYVFNFKITKWLGIDQIKDSTRSISNVGRTMFIPQQPDFPETFEEALARMNITPQQLEQRKREFTRLMIIYLIVALIIFCYGIYIVAYYRNFMGFAMTFAITIYALTHAFRYHFWIYQIKNKKLGCTLKEWFLDIR